jgi:hypothetical protein
MDPFALYGLCEFIWTVVCIVMGVEHEHRQKNLELSRE